MVSFGRGDGVAGFAASAKSAEPTWSENGGADQGAFGFVLDVTLVVGVAHDDDGATDEVNGDYSPGTGEIICRFPSYVLTGSVSGNSASGTYQTTIPGRTSGTWTATVCP